MQGTTFPPNIPAEAQSFVNQILSVDPMQRSTLEKIIEYPWMSQGEEYLSSHSSEPFPKLPDPAINDNHV